MVIANIPGQRLDLRHEQPVHAHALKLRVEVALHLTPALEHLDVPPVGSDAHEALALQEGREGVMALLTIAIYHDYTCKNAMISRQ